MSKRVVLHNDVHYSVVSELNTDVLCKLKALILMSAEGIVVSRNAINGTPKLTSSLDKIFSQPLNFTDDVVACIVSALQAFAQIHADIVPFACVLTIDLILALNDSSQQSLIRVCDFMCAFYSECVEKGTVGTQVASRIDDTIAVVCSVLRNNMACGLYCTQYYEHVTKLVSESFLKSVAFVGQNACRFGVVKHIGVAGYSPESSIVCNGLYIKTLHNSKVGLVTPRQTGRPLTICLFVSSMNGDVDDYVDSDVSSEVQNEDDSHRLAVADWIHCLQALIQNGIAVVACQKVMHPRIKKFLHQRGVISLEQLGSETAMSLAQCTGCTAIQRPSTSISSRHFGSIDVIECVKQFDCWYIYVENARSSAGIFQTVFLCSWTPAVVDELIDVCASCQKVLQRSVATTTSASSWLSDAAKVDCALLKQRRFCAFHFGLLTQFENCLWTEILSRVGIVKPADMPSCSCASPDSHSSDPRVLDRLPTAYRAATKYCLSSFTAAVNVAVEIANFASSIKYTIVQR
jgi:hypothetical protein